MTSKFFLLTSILLFFAPTMDAQESGPAKVYRSQYMQLREKALALIARSQDASIIRTGLQEEEFALLKLTHRLEEESMREYIDRLTRPGGQDKSLLFVAHACNALGFTLQS